MIRTTLGAIYNREVKAPLDHVLYIVRDRDIVLYVGKGETKKGILVRFTNRQHDELWHFLQHCGSTASLFEVELLTIEDSKQRLRPEDYRWSRTVRDFEAALISHYDPCINTHGRPIWARPPLPKKYGYQRRN